MAVTLTPNSPSGTDLISVDRATENAVLSALNTSNPTALASLISAASVAIERYCHRTFSLQSYSEIYSGGGIPYSEIQLANYPVVEITRIATSPQGVLLITNTGTTTNQRATISTTSTGLRLVRVASGTSTTTDLAFATYPTISALATAVGLLGSGWTATVQGSFGSYPTTDLMALQGATSALSNGSGATLEMYTEDSPASGWRLDANIGYLSGRWPQGSLNIRIDYRAGFEEIPEDVQQACVQQVQDLYQAAGINSNVASAKLGPFAYTTLQKGIGLSAGVKSLLATRIDYAPIISLQGS